MSQRVFKSYRMAGADGTTHRNWLHRARGHFDTMVLLNSNGYTADRYGSIPWVYGLGAREVFVGKQENVFPGLKNFADSHEDWLFGFFSYELKNQLEKLSSKNPDHAGWPLCHFFRPQVLIMPEPEGIRIGTLPGHPVFSDPDRVFAMLRKAKPFPQCPNSPVNIQARVDKVRYLKQLKAIKEHIQAGDVYEMNYCIEFFAEDAGIDPVMAYDALNNVSQTPFSCFYAMDQKYLMCASPERFMRKQGTRLISQPVKGTSARGASQEQDMRLRRELFDDPKERSENVMIVDLVRNDLSRTAVKDSVMVEELFGIYPFKQVNQMISTVTSQLHPDCHYLDAVEKAFPMGSMTGAPKYRAMQLIDAFEDSCRGLYSGAVGYISPEKNFDFNVVIRSIVYNEKNRYLSYMAGSAITIGSDPLREYGESLLKAGAMGRVLGKK